MAFELVIQSARSNCRIKLTFEIALNYGWNHFFVGAARVTPVLTFLIVGLKLINLATVWKLLILIVDMRLSQFQGFLRNFIPYPLIERAKPKSANNLLFSALKDLSRLSIQSFPESE